MIFIGAELSDPGAHFVTNIVNCIGTENDLIIDLLEVNDSQVIYETIAKHTALIPEQFVIYNPYIDESFFIFLKEWFPELQLIIVFSDDEWRHLNYDRYLALYSDVFTIAVKANLNNYRNYGNEPFYMQWACNPKMFYPLPVKNKDIDVSFIGAAYGQRVTYIKYLISNKIKVKVFGRGWDRYADIRPYWGGYLSHKEMLVVIARSKINLNFLWTSAEKELSTIKGRTMELSACRAFQLSNTTDEFANYGFIDGENIALFDGLQDIIEKINYYLNHDEQRKAIARQSYEHVLEQHTWEQRFHDIFECLKNKSILHAPVHHKSKILVIVDQNIRHTISPEDERLDIRITDSASDWKKDVLDMDGVIHLDRNSSLNNESLYMMVFGLVADKSDVVAANFYVGDSNDRYWIRIIDRIVEKKRSLLYMLPAPCLMFSGQYVSKHGVDLKLKLHNLLISYIEYPSFEICLSYCQSRLMRLYFAYHGNSRKKLRNHILNFNFAKALSLGIDKIWQNTLQNNWNYKND